VAPLLMNIKFTQKAQSFQGVTATTVLVKLVCRSIISNQEKYKHTGQRNRHKQYAS